MSGVGSDMFDAQSEDDRYYCPVCGSVVEIDPFFINIRENAITAEGWVKCPEHGKIHIEVYRPKLEPQEVIDLYRRPVIDAIMYSLTSNIEETIQHLKACGVTASHEDRELDPDTTELVLYTAMLVEPTRGQIAILNELGIDIVITDFKTGSSSKVGIVESNRKVVAA